MGDTEDAVSYAAAAIAAAAAAAQASAATKTSSSPTYSASSGLSGAWEWLDAYDITTRLSSYLH